MDKSTITTRITEIVATFDLCSVADISERTRLYHDLKISGDDAIELLDEISIEFGVTFEDQYIYDRFPTEIEMSSLSFTLQKMFRKERQIIVTTIGDLVDYIINFKRKNGIRVTLIR